MPSIITVTDQELDLGGVLGLDFVNTVVRTRDGPVDLLETPERFLDWMRRIDASSVEPSMEELAPRDLPGLRLLTVEARQLREALVALLRWVADGEDAAGSDTERSDAEHFDAERFDAGAAFTIDRALGGASATYRLAGLDGVQTCFDRTSPFAPLTPITLSTLEVVRNADPARLRECDADDCVRWFVDTSKGGRRRWCSMARCGNRAKVARYRRRHADEE